MKDNIIEELKVEITTVQAENTTLKEQLMLNTLSNSTVLINSPKEDKEKRILKKRIQDEAKKAARLEELLDHKENEIAKLTTEYKISGDLALEKAKIEEQLQLVQENNNLLCTEIAELNDKLQKLQAENMLPNSDTQNVEKMLQLRSEPLITKQHNNTWSLELGNERITEDQITCLNMPVDGVYKTKVYMNLFKQDPFVCHVCNQLLPAHTQEFTRLNHVKQCKGDV